MASFTVWRCSLNFEVIFRYERKTQKILVIILGILGTRWQSSELLADYREVELETGQEIDDDRSFPNLKVRSDEI